MADEIELKVESGTMSLVEALESAGSSLSALNGGADAAKTIRKTGDVVIPDAVQEKPHGAYTPNVVLESVPPCDDPASAGNAE